MKSSGLYYRYSDTGNGSDHLQVQREQRVSVTVSPNGKSPPAQHPSASNAQLITSTYMLHLAKPTAGRDLMFQAEGRKRLSE